MKNLFLISLAIFSSLSTADSFLGLNAGDKLPFDAKYFNFESGGFTSYYEISPPHPSSYFEKYFGKYVGKTGLCAVLAFKVVPPQFLDSYKKQSVEHISDKYGKPSMFKDLYQLGGLYSWKLKHEGDIMLEASISDYDKKGWLTLRYNFPNNTSCVIEEINIKNSPK